MATLVCLLSCALFAAPATPPAAPFAIPIKDAFRYTSGFGMRWGRMHNGTDFAAPHGTDIRAVDVNAYRRTVR